MVNGITEKEGIVHWVTEARDNTSFIGEKKEGLPKKFLQYTVAIPDWTCYLLLVDLEAEGILLAD